MGMEKKANIIKGPRPRVQRGRLTALGAEGCGRLWRLVVFASAQGATAVGPLRVVDCPAGNDYKVSVTKVTFSII